MPKAQQLWSGFAKSVVEYARGAGADLAKLRAEAGLTDFELADPQRLVPSEKIALLLETAARMLEDAALGLHVAESFEFGILGPFSYAVMNAPTLGTALRNAERHSVSVSAGTRPELIVGDKTTTLRFHFADLEWALRRQLAEAGALIFLRMMRELAGSDWRPVEVCFRHPPPPDQREHRRLFRATLRFDQPADGIVCATSDLHRRVEGANRFLLPIVKRELQDVIRERAEPDLWRRDMEVLVASRICDGHPTLRAIAPELGLSVRTLQRRLDERGLSYRQLVAGVRMQIARHYLQDTDTSLSEIAFLLGYSELSAFDRAFRRWIDRSPSEYRAEKRSSAARIPALESA